MTAETRIVDRAHRIAICPAAPPQLGSVWVAADANCPYCSLPLADHEDFLSLDLKAPEQHSLGEPSDRVKRWLGFSAGELDNIQQALRQRARNHPGLAEAITPLADEAWLAFTRTRIGSEPEQSLSETAKNLIEALDLLALWYGRWQGYVSGTPAAMHSRTRKLLEATGRTPGEAPVQ